MPFCLSPRGQAMGRLIPKSPSKSAFRHETGTAWCSGFTRKMPPEKVAGWPFSFPWYASNPLEEPISSPGTFPFLPLSLSPYGHTQRPGYHFSRCPGAEIKHLIPGFSKHPFSKPVKKTLLSFSYPRPLFRQGGDPSFAGNPGLPDLKGKRPEPFEVCRALWRIRLPRGRDGTGYGSFTTLPLVKLPSVSSV
jgi:hypothetical protein